MSKGFFNKLASSFEEFWYEEYWPYLVSQDALESCPDALVADPKGFFSEKVPILATTRDTAKEISAMNSEAAASFIAFGFSRRVALTKGSGTNSFSFLKTVNKFIIEEKYEDIISRIASFPGLGVESLIDLYLQIGATAPTEESIFNHLWPRVNSFAELGKLLFAVRRVGFGDLRNDWFYDDLNGKDEQTFDAIKELELFCATQDITWQASIFEETDLESIRLSLFKKLFDSWADGCGNIDATEGLVKLVMPSNSRSIAGIQSILQLELNNKNISILRTGFDAVGVNWNEHVVWVPPSNIKLTAECADLYGDDAIRIDLPTLGGLIQLGGSLKETKTALDSHYSQLGMRLLDMTGFEEPDLSKFFNLPKVRSKDCPLYGISLLEEIISDQGNTRCVVRFVDWCIWSLINHKNLADVLPLHALAVRFCCEWSLRAKLARLMEVARPLVQFVETEDPFIRCYLSFVLYCSSKEDNFDLEFSSEVKSLEQPNSCLSWVNSGSLSPWFALEVTWLLGLVSETVILYCLKNSGAIGKCEINALRALAIRILQDQKDSLLGESLKQLILVRDHDSRAFSTNYIYQKCVRFDAFPSYEVLEKEITKLVKS
ncbi:hypothetical protein ACFSSC_12000 [Corynebacterium mendelii]|uniref:Uncharacterized protein n=1 Tax=Corynebacterium mendelii TaxID=2765362 RepID=A0A939IT91_9CORY|nr:hypothetical protein [Corynebacterium mendelii]MBN9643594.1 hypothetical protein [Corynebacterium mendelii]